MNVTQLWFGFDNGPGAIDQIVLGRTEADLETVKPIAK